MGEDRATSEPGSGARREANTRGLMEKTKQDREAVKVLAIAVGVREAARRTGLKESRVLQWSKRDQWFKPTPQPPNQADVITVIKPSVALASVLEQDRAATKLGFSKAARKVAEAHATMAVEALRKPTEASVAKAWTDVAAKAQGWDDGQGRAEGPLGGLQVYSAQTVINVDQRSSDSATDV